MALISVVIPVYKAQECLDELYRRLNVALRSITDDYEIVLVEDCGGDGSWEIITKLAEADPRVRGLQFSRNFGQHYGITAGLDHCDGDWVVVMDCDLQDDPAEIPRLYAKAKEGYEVVLARRGQRTDSRLKSWTSAAFYRLFGYLADIKYDGEVGNFRIVSRRVVESLGQMRERLRFFGGLVSWVGFPTTSIDVVHGDRFAGETSYSFAKLWKLATEIIIAHSDKPLRLAVKAGFLLSLAAFAYGGCIAYRALVYGVPITGWSSLIVSMYFLSGIIISLLGVLGVYLGKTFDESKRRPLYIVYRTTPGVQAQLRRDDLNNTHRPMPT
ncbi:dolichol-phosphate mannosyltransferase [Dyella jiangningensis]|uniref:glycosyltransferase family 2 protein n=1 Tax=Dyella sp. AtDHG13 TaxID=1938897 RepID=UPI000883E7DD|nr:glycosyltransferase family 2 protein [Dyella sp. AtDHG13]PXV61687.1 dolichol-phosphate mannosyltransferase [Dyella sp. AtDHG13]SDJ67226.1 dolichol-phosphate mannosyltransferase [Dyella jiangningensis]